MPSWIRRRARYALDNALVRLRSGIVLMRDVAPRAIAYVQYPEFWTARPGQRRVLPVERLAGDWDRVDSTTTFQWSGAYEHDAGASRMIPIERYGFYRACLARFQDGASWESTEWHAWLMRRLAAGHRVKRYETPEAVRERLLLLDRTFADVVRSGYDAVFGQPSGSWSASRWFSRPAEWDDPVINVGRDGRMAIEDGRHRLCLARLAGTPSVRVRVGALHAEAEA